MIVKRESHVIRRIKSYDNQTEIGRLIILKSCIIQKKIRRINHLIIRLKSDEFGSLNRLRIRYESDIFLWSYDYQMSLSDASDFILIIRCVWSVSDLVWFSSDNQMPSDSSELTFIWLSYDFNWFSSEKKIRWIELLLMKIRGIWKFSICTESGLKGVETRHEVEKVGSFLHIWIGFEQTFPTRYGWPWGSTWSFF